MFYLLWSDSEKGPLELCATDVTGALYCQEFPWLSALGTRSPTVTIDL